MHSALTAQLEAAVQTLVGNGALKDRLCSAYCDHLDDIRQQELPEEVRNEFSAMSRAMHGARALPGDSVVRASVRKFSIAQAQSFAALIVRTYVLRMQGLVLASPVVPARLARTARETPALAAFLTLESPSGRTVRGKRARNSGH
jgi:hypothetical protein